ncbi:MAG: invasion associated locus B family protein [Pseudomonadota bacterium]
MMVRKAVLGRIGGLFSAVLVALVLAAPATAQTQNRVDSKRDWSIFEVDQNGAKICWIVSRPTESAALRGGQRVSVNRGDIFLMVAVRPADGVKNEVSFMAGYPFRQGSEVEAKIGSATFELFTDGENAWAPTPADDDRIVAAFKRGVNARVEGLSSRGTTTIDTFSLLGFTAALDSATARCR